MKLTISDRDRKKSILMGKPWLRPSCGGISRRKVNIYASVGNWSYVYCIPLCSAIVDGVQSSLPWRLSWTNLWSRSNLRWEHWRSRGRRTSHTWRWTRAPVWRLRSGAGRRRILSTRPSRPPTTLARAASPELDPFSLCCSAVYIDGSIYKEKAVSDLFWFIRPSKNR